MPILILAQRLVVLVPVILLMAAAAASADGPPPTGSAGQPGVSAMTPVVPAATTVPVALPSPPVPAPVLPTPPPPTAPVPALTPPAPFPPAPTPPVPVTTPPVSAPIPPVPVSPSTPLAPAESPQPAGPIPVQAPTPEPAQSNATTQTISEVQISPCPSHCGSSAQVQQASQDNTTIQTVSPPTLADGKSSGRAPAKTTATSTRPGGVTQVQVGCQQQCSGTTTLDTSGLTLAQIEQLLGTLQLPPLPPLKPAPGALQNITQQASAQSAGGVGGTASQSQLATQTNTTVQVADGANAGAVAATVVNQTAQGISQVQVGCLFDCTRTRQLQQATQSNTTLQSTGTPGTADATAPPAMNTITRIVWQLQIGCLFRCDDAVESQTAAGTDTTVAIAPPPPAPGPAPTAGGDRASPVAAPVAAGEPATSAPVAAGEPATSAPVAGDAPTAAPPAAGRAPSTLPANPSSPAPSLPAPSLPAPPLPPPPRPATGGQRVIVAGRGDVLGAAFGITTPAGVRPGVRVLGGTAGYGSARTVRGDGLVTVAVSQSLAATYARPERRPEPHRDHHRPAARRASTAHRPVVASGRRAAVASSSSPWLAVGLALAAGLAALGFSVRRRRPR